MGILLSISGVLAARTLPPSIVLVHEDQLAGDFKATSTGTHEWHTLVSRRRSGSLDSSALKQIDIEKVAMRATRCSVLRVRLLRAGSPASSRRRLFAWQRRRGDDVLGVEVGTLICACMP